MKPSGSAAMGRDPLRTVTQLASARPLFAGLVLLMLGSSLVSSLLSIRGETEGFGTLVTGAVLSLYYVGFIAGSLLAPIVVARVGHIRVFAGLTALVTAATLTHAVLVDPITWALARAVTGACLSGLYVVAESWLNSTATNETRGHLLSVYMVVIMGSMGGGQVLLLVADPAGQGLFILGAILIALAIVPISLSASPAPAFPLPHRMKLRELWGLAPVGVISGLGTGIANGAVLMMAPFYAIRSGLSVSQTSLLMTTMIAGAVLLQIPIGRWSTHVRRRRSIIMVNLLAAGAAAAVASLPIGSVEQYVAIFVLGGSTFPIYALGVSHANDVLKPEQIVAASSLLVLIYGLGSILGPPTASLAMTQLDAPALFWFVGSVHLAVALFATYRVSVSKSVPIGDQRAFAAIPARSSSLVGELLRRRREGD